MSILQKYLLSSVYRDAAGEAAAAAAAEAAKGTETKAAAAGAGDKPFWDGALDAEKHKEEIGYLSTKKYPDLGTLARSAMNAEKLATDRNAIRLPEKGKELEWDGWTKLGWIPEKEKFALSPIDETKLPKGFKVDNAMRDYFRDLAHEARLPLAAADTLSQKILEKQIEAHNARVTETEGKRAEMDKTLRAKWGADFDRNSIFAKRAAAALGEQAGLDMEGLAKLNEAMGDPGLVSFFHFLGTQIGEDKLGANDIGPGGVTESVAELDAEVSRLMNDPAWRAIFDNPRHAQHQAHVDQRKRLLERKARAQGVKG